MRSLRKLLYTILLMGSLFTTVSCEDLAFGDKFLQKPPSSDVTIDTIFSSAEYARRILWKSYQSLPYGIETSGYWTQMWLGTLEGLTDLNYDNVGYSGLAKVYYPGNYNASIEDTPRGTYMATKIRFNNNESGMWGAIRHAWLFCENVDRVPDMDDTEKSRLKAEAKMIVAVYYSHMLRHYGGLPIVDHAIDPEDTNLPGRSTLQATVDFIVGLLNEAINCPDFPWRISDADLDNWDGRMCKAGAMALKARVLLFVASPLFNNTEPYCNGEASEQLMTWFGNYDKERWKLAINACEEFFTALNSNGYYKLVESGDNGTSTERQAFTSGYFDRGTTETLISVRRGILSPAKNDVLSKSIRWGGYCPTKEYFDMFQMADGTDFDWNNPEHAKNPFLNRDPRLYETFILDGDDFNGRKAGLTEPDGEDYPQGQDWKAGQMHELSLATGLACRKWGLDRNSSWQNRPIQWPFLRLAEVYLSYAEALNEYYGAPNSQAYDAVDKVRARVSLPGLKKGLGQTEFREALLRERACEFGYEEVRFFDLIRWKLYDVFEKKLHGLHVYKHKDTGEYKLVTFELTKYTRVWWSSGFEPRWCLSAFPSKEINKGYGLVQNPGWE